MGNGGAKSPALGRDRSNKLKEVLDGVDGGGRGYPGNRRRGGMALAGRHLWELGCYRSPLSQPLHKAASDSSKDAGASD